MLFYIYLALDAVFAAFGGYFLFRYTKRKKLLDHDTFTTGIITVVKKSKTSFKAVEGKDIYSLSAEYTVDGRTYTTTIGVNANEGDFPEGQTIEIIYDMKKPSNAVPRIYADSSEINKMSLLVGLLPFIFMTIGVVLAAPHLLSMSRENERIYNIISRTALAVLTGAYLIRYLRSETYKKELQKNSKSAKSSIASAAFIITDCIFKVLTELFLK